MDKSDIFQDPDLDQVFMTDENVLSDIIELCDLKKSETVLEIGSGPGNLTEALAAKCKKVVTIEIDERRKDELEKKFSGKNVQIVWGNALEILEKKSVRFDRIVANPPYAISEALIKALFRHDFISSILTLPSKFVERLAANPEEDRYSRLSLFSQAFFKIETLLRVEKSAWTPSPDTSSFVVKLTPRKPADSRELLLREMSLQDDKKLKNALRDAMSKSDGKTKRSAMEVIRNAGVPKKLLDKKISEIGLRDIMEVAAKFGGKKYKLVAFDLDGTLIDEKECIWKIIHDHVGTDPKIREDLMEKFFSGKITYADWAYHDIERWKEMGVTMDTLAKKVKEFRLMPGAMETLKTLKKKGYKLALISGSIGIVLDTFIPDAHRIFDHVVINRLTFEDDGKITGIDVPEDYKEKESKARSLERIASLEGVSPEECVFVGDSDNDFDVMKVSGLSIGFMPTKKISSVSDVIIKKKDVREIMKYLNDGQHNPL